jgi:hypothetical protein
MGQEGELSEEIEAARFRDQMFLHAIASQNPELYLELYDDPDVPEEWEVPQSLDDLHRMIGELAEVGVTLDDTPPPDFVPHEAPDAAHLGVQPAMHPWNA